MRLDNNLADFGRLYCAGGLWDGGQVVWPHDLVIVGAILSADFACGTTG